MQVSTPPHPKASGARHPKGGLAPRGDLLAEACPSREVLKHMTSRWGLLVLMVLTERTHRFAELRRTIGGVSERMLAQTLQWLEHDGLVLRVARDVVPPHVEYSLTPLGRDASRQVVGLTDWIESHMPQVMAARTRHAVAVAGRSRRTATRAAGTR
jgi:DNA-binding HxlR family transcriptional regulator